MILSSLCNCLCSDARALFFSSSETNWLDIFVCSEFVMKKAKRCNVVGLIILR